MKKFVVVQIASDDPETTQLVGIYNNLQEVVHGIAGGVISDAEDSFGSLDEAEIDEADVFNQVTDGVLKPWKRRDDDRLSWVDPWLNYTWVVMEGQT